MNVKFKTKNNTFSDLTFSQSETGLQCQLWKMGAEGSSKVLVPSYQTTWRHTQEVSTPHTHHFHNFFEQIT
jgi:hypothetical protein